MPTIGEELQKARKKKGMTIDDIQKETKIQKRYIKALEMDAFHLLPGTPGTFYVRTFVRQYANAVDLDPDELLRILDAKGRPVDDDPELASYRESVSHSRSEIYESKASTGKVRRAIPVLVLAIVAIGILAITIYISFQDRKRNPIIPDNSSVEILKDGETSSSSETEASESSSSEQPEQTESSSAEPEEKMTVEVGAEAGIDTPISLKKAADPVTLHIEAGDLNCWLGVTVNGAYISQASLAAGESTEIALPAGTKSAVLVLGNSTGVKVTVNGEAVNYNPNNTGVVKRNLVFTVEYK